MYSILAQIETNSCTDNQTTPVRTQTLPEFT